MVGLPWGPWLAALCGMVMAAPDVGIGWLKAAVEVVDGLFKGALDEVTTALFACCTASSWTAPGLG